MTAPLTLEEQEVTGLAIKATGRTAHDIDEHGAWFRGEPDPIIGAWQHFNPLRSDTDAFRLAVQLRMTLTPSHHSRYGDGWHAQWGVEDKIEWHVAYPTTTGRDLAACARLAIVECAATVYRHKRIKDTTP